MNSKRNELILSYFGRPEKISRAVARDFDMPWATAWDIKRDIKNGKIKYDSVLTKPKILLFDIETAPLLVHNWSLWSTFTSLNQVMEDWFMLSWSAKWLDEDKKTTRSLPDYPSWKKDKTCDKALVTELYEMLNEADFIIGHNLKKFDNKKSKARFLKHGLTMPDPYRMIDTLDIAKREFALTSNKLDWLATYLGYENKVSHEGHNLWVRCMAGDMDAWDIMTEYNEYDTVLLESVYKHIRGWSSNHPNVAVYYNDFQVRCPVCGGTHITPITKTHKTNLSEFPMSKCGDCGKVSRTGNNLLSKKKRASLLRNVI